MRIRRLDLTRYGKFTDRSLDFGEWRPGQPDFHILYGPNEAGKSTTLAAWLDLLFGIGQQTRYSFLHQGPTMRIGAVLEIAGKEVSVARIKTRTNSLLDGLGAPIPEAVLQGGLGGLGRESYQSMFSLDDETLAEGGESILASQGDLGELLFSSSAGLTGLSRRLKELQSGADVFLKTARTGRLFDLKKQQDTLEADRKAIDIQAPDYVRRVEALKAADLAWATANAELAAANSHFQRLARVDAARPLAWRLSEMTERLAAAKDAPEPPAEWAAEYRDLMAEKAAAGAKAELHVANIRRLTDRLAETPVDQAALDLAGPMAEVEALRSAHDEAVKDLPARRDALHDAEASINALMGQLGMAGKSPDDVLLPAERVSALRALMAEHSGLQTALATARKEADDAIAQAEEAEAKLSGSGGIGADTVALASLLGAIKSRDPAHALRQAKASATAAQAVLAERLLALAPWQGTPEALSRQTVPARDHLHYWSQNAETARRAVGDAAAEVGRLKAEIGKQQALLDARAMSGRLSPDDLAAVRGERERLWSVHLSRLDPASATAFEAAMRRDDQLVSDHAASGAEAALQAQSRETLAVLTTQLVEAVLAQTGAETAAAELAQGWAALLGAISQDLPATWQASDLRSWLDLRDLALKADADLARQAANLRLAEEEVALAATDLSAALSGVTGQPTLPQSLEALLATASALVDTADKRATLVEAAASLRRSADRRQTQLSKAEAAATAWHAAWSRLNQGSWLETGAAPDLDLAARQIDLMEELRAAVFARQNLADRVDKMTANRTAFRKAVAGIAEKLGFDAPEATSAWTTITRRLREAEDARAAADRARADLQQETANLAAQDEILRLKTQRLQEMADSLGLEDVDSVGEALAAAAERAQGRLEISRLQADLVQTTRCATLAEAVTMVHAFEGQDLDAMLSAAKSAAEAAQVVTQTRFADLSRAQADLEAVGGDDAVARLEEARQTILLQIEEEAQQHLRRRFGIIAVEHALRAYRDSHRSAMLARASAAFQTISRGAYTGLASQPDKDREVLVALAADGTSKLAPDLSKGTRFQLYLALRAAGYHVLAEARPPVPFIADDIMETFDDDRSAEAFALLGDMAKVGQVIYLTHHQHLCEIARKVCPEASIRAL